MAVTINHEFNLAGLSELSVKLEQMVKAIDNSFSQYADTLGKASETPLNSQNTAQSNTTSQNTKLFNSEDLIKSNKDLVQILTKLNSNITSTSTTAPKKIQEGDTEGKSIRNSRIFGATLAGIIGTTLYKLGAQYENLGTTVGQQFQAVNQSAFNSKQFVQAQVSNQLNSEYAMTKTITTGASTVAGAGAGAALGSVVPLLGTTIGGALGGGIGYLYSAYQNFKNNEELERKKAVSQFGLNAADQAYYLNLAQNRFGADVALTGRQLQLPQFQDVTGKQIGGLAPRITQLQEQLIREKSPFLNNAYDILRGIPGNTREINTHEFVNNIGKTALATGVNENQMGLFANQVVTLSKYGNKDTNTILNKINENQQKYGGDTVQNLQLVKQVMQTTRLTDFDKAMDFVSRNQMNQTMLQAGINWEAKNPMDKFLAYQFGKQTGFDMEYLIKNKQFAPSDVRKIGTLDYHRITQNQVTAQILAEMFAGTNLQSILNNKPIPVDTTKVSPITGQALNQGAPSTQEFMQTFSNALDNLTTINASANTIFINGSNIMSDIKNTLPSFKKHIVKDHSGAGINYAPSSESGADNLLDVPPIVRTR